MRAIERDALPFLRAYNIDLAVEPAGGGDPPMPQSLARSQAAFDASATKGGRDGATFGIEVGGTLIGSCGLFGHSATDGYGELGIGIGDKAH